MNTADQPTPVGSQTSQASQANPSLNLPRTAVTLQEATDAVRATFTSANQAGFASARITLSPAALGGIKISLQQTTNGLVARVVADHPDATQTLQQNAGDLKRSLEASGMTLLRLDISSTGDHSLGGFQGSEQDGSSAGNAAYDGQSDPTDGDTDVTDSTTELTVTLASGSLVNVLA